MTRVIAVAGASGAGKSALVAALRDRLSPAASLHFDDYFEGPPGGDDRQWLAEGADPEVVQTPAMVEALAARRDDPALAHVVVEEPFGRCRSAIAPLIDLVVCIDVPLEIALARVIRRALDAGDPRGPARVVERLGRLVDGFLDRHRDIYRIVNARVMADCDLIVDGERPIAELVDEIVARI